MTLIINDTDHHLSRSTSPTHIHESISDFEFSADAEEELYYRRLEEGYNLTDQTYDAWLNTHHPDLNKSMSSPN